LTFARRAARRSIPCTTFCVSGFTTCSNVAIDLSHFYFQMGAPNIPLPEALIFKVLTAPALFVTSGEMRNAVSEDYDWTQLATAYVDQHAERSIELATLMLDHFRETGTIVGAFRSQTNEVLEKILRRFPDQLWQRITGLLGPPIDSRAFHIYHWLREGALTIIPAEHVWNWVEQDIEKRGWYVAQFVPSVFPGDEKAVSARGVLVRYGSRKDVRSNLIANFSTEMWSGPESSHAQQKLEQLMSWKEARRTPMFYGGSTSTSRPCSTAWNAPKIEEEREF